MDTTQPRPMMERWHVIQNELPAKFAEQFGGLTPKLQKVIHAPVW